MRLQKLLGVLALGALGAVVSQDASASSHREAPFMSTVPKVDSTDFYMFQSYETGKTGMTTILANYIGLQDAWGGPNYTTFDPNALYEIHIDNNGDGKEDITFQFQFANTLKNILIPQVPGAGMISIPTVQANVAANAQALVPPITAANADMFLNVKETYTMTVVKGDRRTGTATPVTNPKDDSANFVKPADYIGSRTFGNAAAYKAYADTYKYQIAIPGCTGAMGQVFVGPRQDGFRVNLGLIFDLVNVTNAGGLAAITAQATDGNLTQKRSAFNVADATKPYDGPTAKNLAFDNTANKNVETIALEIPTKCLLSDGMDPSASAHPVIGGWTSASLRQAHLINPTASFAKPEVVGGPWVQVSRLGMPLTNEVIIGLDQKDFWNSTPPSGDEQFDKFYTAATLPQILGDLFGGMVEFPKVSRDDLVAIFETGVKNVNQLDMTTHADMLRLNTKFGEMGKKSGSQVDLGAALCFHGSGSASCTSIETCTAPDPTAAGCDLGGFPNGRRVGDDIVDIELTVLLGYFIPRSAASSGGTILHDAVLNTESQFDAAFPYLKMPHSGDQ